MKHLCTEMGASSAMARPAPTTAMRTTAGTMRTGRQTSALGAAFTRRIVVASGCRALGVRLFPQRPPPPASPGAADLEGEDEHPADEG